MTIKDAVLHALGSSMGNFVSGEELAQRLSVSRNAVWRSVKALQQEGYYIQAVTHRGYCLSAKPDVLSAQSISQYLPQELSFFDISIYKTITSTNKVLKDMAEKGAAEGRVLVAEEQTAGKGRMNRAFYSPAGTGVYVSLLLRPRFSAADSLYVTTAAAVAVAEAIEAIAERETKIKWVNDVYCDGKKVCGILTEAAFDMESSGLAYAVLGIGINVRPPERGFPEELRPIVTSVFDGGGYDTDTRNRLVAEVLSRFWGYYGTLTQKKFLKGYQDRSLLKGRDVYVIDGNEKELARALEIDDQCRLHVRYADGRDGYLSSGEVSVKPVQSVLSL